MEALTTPQAKSNMLTLLVYFFEKPLEQLNFLKLCTSPCNWYDIVYRDFQATSLM
jgi:hypothetical protein